MNLIKVIKKSRYHLSISVLLIVMIVGGFKVVGHFMDWEVIPKELT